MSDIMKVCYFGSYAPDYPRHRIIIKGLRAHGVEVTEVRDSSNILIRYPKLARKYFAQKDFDVIFVGEASNYVQPLAILLKKITVKPLVFDTYVSLYDTNQDRGIHQNPVLSKIFYLLDKYNCQFSNLVLQDTNQNIDYFHETFNIPKNKFKRLLIGAENDIFYPQSHLKPENENKDEDNRNRDNFRNNTNNDEDKDNKNGDNFRNHANNDEKPFKVLFYGTYIPLHGIHYIIKAAKILENENIEFQLIGKGQTFSEIKNLKEELNLSNIKFINIVPYETLPQYIASSDVCLGIFGGNKKSLRVIPTKAYQILAMQKPLITEDSPGARELLINQENALLCEGANAESLADSILELKNNPELSHKIAENGYKLFKEMLTPEKIGKEALNILKEVIK